MSGDDVEPENCYQFVRGHDLYDYIRDSLLKPLTQEAKSQHIIAIKASNPQHGDDIQHYRKNLIDVDMSFRATMAIRAIRLITAE